MASKPFSSGHILASADVNDLGGVLDRSTSAFDLVSSSTQTTIWSKSVAANAMSTDRMLRCTIIGDYLNNTGSNTTLVLSIQFGPGPTILWQDGPSASIPTAATRRRFQIEFVLANIASASVQQMSGRWSFSSAAAGSGGGIGDIDTLQFNSVFGGTSAVNTTSAATLLVQAKHDTPNANLSLRKTYAMLELL